MYRFIRLAAIAATALVTPFSAAAQDRATLNVESLARDVVLGQAGDARKEALIALEQRGELDVVPSLIQGLRFIRSHAAAINQTLQAITGEDLTQWHDWMLWQEAHPEIEPHDGFDAIKADVMASIDPNFRLFLYRGVPHDIRLEEITWGGVVKDGIPALVNPLLIAPEAADYLDDELVFGVSINGDVRAYPLRIMDWHEMFNDVIGGVPVALAYCTLCGSGILYETSVEGFDQPLEFGSSGFLYRSNKLMYDRGTNSLWNQFTGQPVVGKLTGSGVQLKTLPVAITTWQDWLARHPDTMVLSLDTGYRRDYRPGRPYGSYFASPDLMFPALVTDRRLAAKDYVFALRNGPEEKAWPLDIFDGGAVINDEVGASPIVLIGNAATRTVRAFDGGGLTFAATTDPATVEANGQSWEVTEDALVAGDGTRLDRLSGHIAYWFAFNNFRSQAPVYEP